MGTVISQCLCLPEITVCDYNVYIEVQLFYLPFTGSFSFSILSGKIMFRDVVYITQDLSFR